MQLHLLYFYNQCDQMLYFSGSDTKLTLQGPDPTKVTCSWGTVNIQIKHPTNAPKQTLWCVFQGSRQMETWRYWYAELFLVKFQNQIFHLPVEENTG